MTLGALWGHSGPILESPWTEIRNFFLICFASSRLGGNREAKSIFGIPFRINRPEIHHPPSPNFAQSSFSRAWLGSRSDLDLHFFGGHSCAQLLVRSGLVNEEQNNLNRTNSWNELVVGAIQQRTFRSSVTSQKGSRVTPECSQNVG